MNIETIGILSILFVFINIVLFKYGRKILSKSGFRISLFLLYSFSIIIAGLYLYRFGMFGHLDYIDGISHRPDRPAAIVRPVPPKFESQPSQVWDNAKQEHRNNVESFSKP